MGVGEPGDEATLLCICNVQEYTRNIALQYIRHLTFEHIPAQHFRVARADNMLLLPALL